MGDKKKKMPQIGEAVFCIVYLVFGLVTAAVMFNHNTSETIYIGLFGWVALTLVCGDAFHLVPRIFNAFRKEYPTYEFWAGLGLLVSSITMTGFYLVLYYAWNSYGDYCGGDYSLSKVVLIILWGCAVLRIILCLFPQNNWFKKEGNSKWGVIRNIPFIVVGVIMVAYFVKIRVWSMAIAIVVSFACYLPVVLWAKKNPQIGMLMMPKTVAYMWMLGVGLTLL